MTYAALNLHFPSWTHSETTEIQQPVTENTDLPEANANFPAIQQPVTAVQETVPVPKLNEELPQGIKAAELAAASKPMQKNLSGINNMPAPLLPAGPFNPLANDTSYLSTSLLPEPSPLGEPLVEAGVSLPELKNERKENDDTIWNMADLKSLPIPGLGSIQVAHAASIDMPVPATTPTQSPFTPAEQINPAGNQGRVLPGAPDFPQNIPAARPGDSAPLPQRQPTLGQTGGYSPVPNRHPVAAAPAPNIQPKQQTNINPNLKAQELARQQQDILMLRQQMDQRLQDLQTAEGKMKNMLQQAKNVEDQKVKTLIQMYANMKPRTAAQALENMDERIAVRILSGMAPKQSGEILTYTNPAKTAKFSEMITRLRMGE